MSVREPTRSMSTPTGICMAAYTISCTTANDDSTAAVTWNRSVADTPATPTLVRCMTATRYAKTPIPKMTQDRREFTRRSYCRATAGPRSAVGQRVVVVVAVTAEGEEVLQLG